MVRSSSPDRAVVSSLRRGGCLAVSIAALLIGGIGGCDKPKDRTPDEAAIAAAIEQGRRELEAADRQMRERAAEDELARREAEQAEVDARKELVARLEERLRTVLLDPSSMQIRDERLNDAGTALCAEVSGKNKQGVAVGFRRVVVSESIISFDRDPDDTYREPQYRYPAVAAANGC